MASAVSRSERYPVRDAARYHRPRGACVRLGVCIEGAGRVVRGGSWINNGRNTRSAYRNRNAPDTRNDNCGFRLALAQGW